jgi:hypothetical protein
MHGHARDIGLVSQNYRFCTYFIGEPEILQFYCKIYVVLFVELGLPLTIVVLSKKLYVKYVVSWK